MFESVIKKKFLNSLENIKYGSLEIIVPEGEVINFQGSESGQQADLQIDDWRTIVNLSFKGDVGFAEDYRDGYWHTSDLTALLLFAFDNEAVLEKYIDGNAFFKQLSRLGYLTRRNTIKGSRRPL